MNQLNELFSKLQGWIKVIQASLIGVTIIQAILVIIIGIASNKIEETFNYWAGILIGCGLVYVSLVVITTLYQYKFPGSIVEELQAKRELEEKNKLFDRQKAINEYIDTAIKGLNKETCSIGYNLNENLCDQDLVFRLKELLKPIISYTDVILDTTTEKKFTIGMYLNFYYKPPINYDLIQLEYFGGHNEFAHIKNTNYIIDKGILILCDELNLNNILHKNLLSIDRAVGAQYEIQTAIKRTLNNATPTMHDFSENEIEYTIICSEILETCSDESVNGVFFIISQKGIDYPTDVFNILSIFNRVTANYVSKYSDCVLQKIKDEKTRIINEQNVFAPELPLNE